MYISHVRAGSRSQTLAGYFLRLASILDGCAAVSSVQVVVSRCANRMSLARVECELVESVRADCHLVTHTAERDEPLHYVM